MIKQYGLVRSYGMAQLQGKTRMLSTCVLLASFLQSTCKYALAIRKYIGSTFAVPRPPVFIHGKLSWYS